MVPKLGTLAMTLAVILGGLFNVGCSGGFFQRVGSDAIEGAFDRLKDEGAALLERGKEIVAQAEEKAIAAAEAKIAEIEARNLTIIDANLAAVGTNDPATGGVIAKTWRDFDIDKSGRLQPSELVKVQTYVTSESTKKVLQGELSTDEALRINKDTALALGGLGVAGAGAAALAARRRRILETAKKPPASAGAAPPDPKAATG